MELKPGVWRLAYGGNGNLGAMGTEAAFLRRSAELCKEAGYDYFVIEQEHSSNNTHTIDNGSSTAYTSISPDYATPGGYRAITTVDNEAPTTYRTYKHKGRVVGYKEGTQPKGAYKASLILDKYKD